MKSIRYLLIVFIFITGLTGLGCIKAEDPDRIIVTQFSETLAELQLEKADSILDTLSVDLRQKYEAELLKETKTHLQANDLTYAAGKGLMNILNMMLQSDIDYQQLNNDSFTSLLLASRNGLLNVVNTLLNQEIDVNQTNKEGITPLRYAVLFGHYDVAEALLEAGANVNQKDKYSWTPLPSAVANNDTKMVQLLLKYGAVPNYKTPRGNPPLIDAILVNNYEMASVLLSAKANPNAKDSRHQYPAIFWSVEKGSLDMVKLLVEHKADINVQGNRKSESPLMRAIVLRNQPMVEYLLKMGADKEQVDSEGWDALVYAEKSESEDIIELLK
ncbi:MAG: ankyrin repeat domain-containing protein [Candidatus Cloacimonas sp.]|nr:ankyrin repeat domain-containing protein [Candidatus Cloacimonadota bacterium]